MSYDLSDLSIGRRALAILSDVVGESFFLDVDVDVDVEGCGVDVEARALSAISC